jgi:hypothetical protein
MLACLQQLSVVAANATTGDTGCLLVTRLAGQDQTSCGSPAFRLRPPVRS